MLAIASFTLGGTLHLLAGTFARFWSFGMNELSPVSLTKYSSNQLKKTCLSSCEKFAQSIESASVWEFEVCFGGRLDRFIDGGSPGVGGFEGKGDTVGEGEWEDAPGRVVRIIGGGSSGSSCDLPGFEGEWFDRGGGGGSFDLGSAPFEGLLYAKYPLSDRQGVERKGMCSPDIDLWHC